MTVFELNHSWVEPSLMASAQTTQADCLQRNIWNPLLRTESEWQGWRDAILMHSVRTFPNEVVFHFFLPSFLPSSLLSILWYFLLFSSSSRSALLPDLSALCRSILVLGSFPRVVPHCRAKLDKRWSQSRSEKYDASCCEKRRGVIGK